MMAGNAQIPFLAYLNLPNFSNLTNDPIEHGQNWPAMIANLPSDIPKFEGKQGKDLLTCWTHQNVRGYPR